MTEHGQITQDACGQLAVPATPIIPFIEGDGLGPGTWAASVRGFDAAVEKAGELIETGNLTSLANETIP